MLALVLFLVSIKLAIIIIFIYYFVKSKGHRFVVFLIFLGYLITEIICIPNFRSNHASSVSSSREKACFANQRGILGAIDIYNLDHSETMKKLDVEALIKDKYLKTIVKPTNDCDYLSKGDLSKDGFIYCKKHGNVIEVEEQRKKEKDSIFFIVKDGFKQIGGINYFGGIVYCLFVIGFRWVFKKEEDEDLPISDE